MSSDAAVTYGVALLHTIGHLQFATIDHLHAICMPEETISRARLSLAALRAGGYVTATPWRLPRVCQERGSVWTLTPGGRTWLYGYGITVETLPTPELDVPSTPLERDEWRIRMAVRSLIVRLVVQARRVPTVADIRVQVYADWPTPYAPPRMEGDAQLDVVWTSPIVQPPDWLPWTASSTVHSGAARAFIYVDRPLPPDRVLHFALERASQADATAVVIWQTAERLAQAVDALAALPAHDVSIRMTTYDLIASDVFGASWRDARGRPCSLRPQIEELRSYHVPATA